MLIFFFRFLFHIQNDVAFSTILIIKAIKTAGNLAKHTMLTLIC